MNRAFLIIGIPAFVTSFCWLWFGWGLRRAVIVTGIELVVVVAGVICLVRRQNARSRTPEAGG